MASAKVWEKKIKQACIDVGTYEACFDYIIKTLADILESRDTAYEQFIKSGAQPVIRYTNKGGATNPAKNPLMLVWDDLNKSALAYWRDLGLTPAGLRKLNDQALQPKKKLSALDKALAELG